ncbi:unnamed protein product [Zymoseptoria tritici ST99CH_1A5]|uniref:Uncharacterized protein n=1 Tax=Zymoseptoria tritici ST99CH_1A5 TaxID=1276529 RepID=A0A1Y6L4U3_ZYMTR|nr:unnamed protein product [Zymoseptoria tritici ST99CH_1A5]
MVNFFPSREALESRPIAPTPTSHPPTPAYSIGSPQSANGIPATPNLHTTNGYHAYQHMPSSTLTPRFGMMGIGAPQGSEQHTTPDLLAWNNQALPAPRELQLPPLYEAVQAERKSCCQQSPPPAQPLHSPSLPMDPPFQRMDSLPELSFTQNYTNMHEPVTLPAASRPSSARTYVAPAFDFDRMQAEYLAHQFPSAICQNCGLSGCTCRSCPPIFQSYGTTSWAQCCGRKHARDVQPIPVAAKIPRTENYAGEGLRAPAPPSYVLEGSYSQAPSYALEPQAYTQFNDIGLPPPTAQSEFPNFELDPGLLLPDTGQRRPNRKASKELEVEAEVEVEAEGEVEVDAEDAVVIELWRMIDRQVELEEKKDPPLSPRWHHLI